MAAVNADSYGQFYLSQNTINTQDNPRMKIVVGLLSVILILVTIIAAMIAFKLKPNNNSAILFDGDVKPDLLDLPGLSKVAWSTYPPTYEDIVQSK